MINNIQEKELQKIVIEENNQSAYEGNKITQNAIKEKINTNFNNNNSLFNKGEKNSSKQNPNDGYDFFDKPGRKGVDGNSRPFGGASAMNGENTEIENDNQQSKKNKYNKNPKLNEKKQIKNLKNSINNDKNSSEIYETNPPTKIIHTNNLKNSKQISKAKPNDSQEEMPNKKEREKKNLNSMKKCNNPRPNLKKKQQLLESVKQNNSNSNSNSQNNFNYTNNRYDIDEKYPESQNIVTQNKISSASNKINYKGNKNLSHTNQFKKTSNTNFQKSSNYQANYKDFTDANDYDRKIIVPTKNSNQNFEMNSEAYQENTTLFTCRSCGRKFVEATISKHEAVCQKVFQEKRKKFDSAKHRIIDQEQKQISIINKKSQMKSNSKNKASGIKKSLPKWKMESENFRRAMKSMKNNGDDFNFNPMKRKSKQIDYAESQGYIKCQTCGRSFNSEAAEKHIPFCSNKSKMDRIKLNGGKKKVIRKQY